MPQLGSAHDTAPEMPLARVRWIASGLVTVHLIAIVLTVVSFSTPSFPAPRLAVAASQPTQPYLQATFLNNAYRFFAPNPGTPSILWFRVQYEDRSIRWIEAPASAGPLTYEAYQRRLNFTIMIGQQLAPDPAHEGKRRMTPTGEAALASCARHIARMETREVKSVGIYILHHAIITPEQVRTGWTPTDVRTYHATFVGAYSPTGERMDEMKPGVLEQPMGHLIAGILDVDVYPLIRQSNGDPVKTLDTLGIPLPIRRILTAHPELLDPSEAGPNMQERIEKLAGQ